MSNTTTIADVFAYTATQTNSNPNNRSVDFNELRRRVKAAGLLEKQPTYYTIKFIVTLGFLALGIFFILTLNNPWLIMLNAIYMAFVYVQIGTLGHDLAHHQIMGSARWTEIVGLFLGNLFLGMSRSWWVDKHNTHHAHPNQLDQDPDIDFPVLVFDAAQFEGKSRWQLALIRYQAYLFFPILTLVSISMRAHSLLTVISNPVKHRIPELITLILHSVGYLALVFYALPIGQGLLFVLLHQALFGLYMGGIFAPNHKGMPILGPNEHLDYLRLQILTSRNVTGNPLTDFLYGGLNYQVEHHLFPAAPRNKLKQIHEMTTKFCTEHGIPFYETSLVRSYIEIVQNLHEISEPLRRKNTLAVAGS